MSDCQDYPTVQTIQAFGKDAPCFTEIVTSNADRTTTTASDGQTKKTIAAALRDAGWVNVFYNNQRFAPVNLPYTVDSAANPNPNDLVPAELRDISKFLSLDDLSQYTDIVYKSSGNTSAVDNMIASPLSVAIGDILKLAVPHGKSAANPPP